jgi:valyl-tRNA synthetase
MPHDLPKAYDPTAIEDKWAAYWVSENLFAQPTPPPPPNPPGVSGEAFSILLPPPNVTGRLHMGHMLNQTEMDILTRWRRMRGRRALWLPGTDHAGIATQMMVERQLAEEGTSREKLGREAFEARVWEWKRHYGGAILDQMKRLGDSVDWNREYFTMDENLSVAVREAFVRLYEQGLIYRGAYIVNWCPRCQTAISDLEVVHEEQKGHLWEIRYPVLDDDGSESGEFLTIATTRPETMLGDTAVAIHPEDERYLHLHGKKLRLPLVGRVIPIILDEWVSRDFGTGAVKVTPAHDPNDFALGERHHLPSINVMDTTAHINAEGGVYTGLDRYVARKRILEDLEAQGLLFSVKEHTSNAGHCDRCKTVVEPRLSTQWFVAVNKKPNQGGASMAEKAIAAVKPGPDASLGDPSVPPGAPGPSHLGTGAGKKAIRFTPEQYEKTYLNWMENIYDWCISRQLWWGHRIPAWHCAACSKITVAREDPTACAHCGSGEIKQETDVLDTWFSSGLLPVSVFGWPKIAMGTSGVKSETSSQTMGAPSIPRPSAEWVGGHHPLTGAPGPSHLETGEGSVDRSDFDTFYPTSLLVTGFDILFFWVARMIMLGCWFSTDVPMPDGSPRPLSESVPFREVYIHALVRDANREKMSKTKGNVIDPIEIVKKFGTDAVRFTLASMASPGTDIAFNVARTEGYRAFANKIWNAARFIFMNIDRAAEIGITVDPAALGAMPKAGQSAQRQHAPQGKHAREGQFVTEGKYTEGGGGFNPRIKPTDSEGALAPEGRSHDASLEARWIVAELNSTAQLVSEALQTYRFDEAANIVYQFFWGSFCDWYLEIVKLRLIFDDPAKKDETQAALTTLVSVFEASLRLLSPFMPFITEEIWHAVYNGNPPAKSIALTHYPLADYTLEAWNTYSQVEMQSLQSFIVEIRALRKEIGIEEKASTSVEIRTNASLRKIAEENRDIIERLARVSEIRFVDAISPNLTTRSTPAFDVAVIYERTIDVKAERERLTKDIAKYEKGIAAAERQLGNEGFLAKAPANIVEGLKKQESETRLLLEKAKAALAALPPEN